jgi:hypothetical protein
VTKILSADFTRSNLQNASSKFTQLPKTKEITKQGACGVKQIAELYRNGSGTTSTGIAPTAPEFSGASASSFPPGLLKPRFT